MEKKSHYYGLTEAEVLKSREQHGVNILTPPEKQSLLSKFMEKFEDPLIRILLVAGLLSIGIACYEFWGLGHNWTVFFEPIGIFVAILLATGLSFYFELIADKEFSILNQVNDDEPVKVIRNRNTIEIPKRDDRRADAGHVFGSPDGPLPLAQGRSARDRHQRHDDPQLLQAG